MPQMIAEYSKGTIAAARAARNAEVKQYCASAPVRPQNAIRPKSSKRNGRHCGTASNPATVPTITRNQNTMAAVESTLPMKRTAITVKA